MIAGAIRWDAWYSRSDSSISAQNALSPQRWQFRAPWFAQAISPYYLSAQGTQSNMDTEIACAKAAGIKYWAYDKYDPASSLSVGWSLHQSSANKNDVKWCWIVQDPADFGSTGNFSAQVAQFVAWFQQSNYQAVLTNRPLLYFLFTSSGPTFSNSTSNFATMITALRAACVSAGLGSPYIVTLAGASSAAAFSSAIGGDAISIYIPPITAGQPTAFSTLTSAAESYWATQAATGAKIIPCCGMGGDSRPRKQNPTPWEISTYAPAYSGLLNYVTPGTVSERAQHIQNCATYIGANPSSCESTAMLIYSWNEFDEGGGALCPTIGDPPVNNTTNLLTAIGAVLN